MEIYWSRDLIQEKLHQKIHWIQWVNSHKKLLYSQFFVRFSVENKRSTWKSLYSFELSLSLQKSNKIYRWLNLLKPISTYINCKRNIVSHDIKQSGPLYHDFKQNHIKVNLTVSKINANQETKSKRKNEKRISWRGNPINSQLKSKLTNHGLDDQKRHHWQKEENSYFGQTTSRVKCRFLCFRRILEIFDVRSKRKSIAD